VRRREAAQTIDDRIDAPRRRGVARIGVGADFGVHHDLDRVRQVVEHEKRAGDQELRVG
jgi:hypothetical protein